MWYAVKRLRKSQGIRCQCTGINVSYHVYWLAAQTFQFHESTPFEGHVKIKQIIFGETVHYVR